MRIEIPEIAAVALVGVSGSGKSTFAGRFFKPTEVLSSDYFRALVSDDENNQQATPQAFDALYYVAGKRLELGLLTVIDATNVQKEARASVLRLAKEQNCHAVAIVLDMPEKLCRERNKNRPGRDLGGRVIARQGEQLRRSIRFLRKERFRYVYVLKSEDELDGVEIARVPLWNNRKGEAGPFDIIGDVHGCYGELCALLGRLGYAVDRENFAASPPEGRRAVFLGDICDRGPDSAGALRLVMGMVRSGAACCVAGNHDARLLKKLRGANVQLNHGLGETMEQLSAQSEEFIEEAKAFLDGLVSHYVFDSGRLVVAHAGLKEKYQGRASGRVRDFCLYGDTAGEIDEYGLPVRLPWASEYRGKATVVYGHTPAPDVEAVNNTYCIDTGCVFGGKLTAFRYPEKEIVQVAAERTYCAPARPVSGGPAAGGGAAARGPAMGGDSDAGGVSDGIAPDAGGASGTGYYGAGGAGGAGGGTGGDGTGGATSADGVSGTGGDGGAPRAGDVLNIDDVLGLRYVSTRLRRSIKINAENSAAALEVMSRFAADPHWLIYLPPTMSPCETSSLPDYLEYPTEAFGYYQSRGVGEVVCEQKHMGSRAAIVLCKDAETAAERFKASDGSFGIIYTRTGRHFFDDSETQNAILARLQKVLGASGFWDDFGTGWVCLDAELMPWSSKARKLLEEQYAPAGRAGRSGLAAAIGAIGQAAATGGASGDGVAYNGPSAEAQSRRNADLPALLERYQNRAAALDLYTDAYRRYCWDVKSLDDYRIAPFHVLATEGRTWCGESHAWHMETIAKYMAGADPIFTATDYLRVSLLDEASVAAGVKWWEELTAAGGEGMVVKPLSFIATKGSELLQPAVKCRGREYLRIIYGPEYMLGDNLARLKKRSLSKKRGLALSEFALGVEALERFARNEPLYRVHECVFGVLAMESEPVDPRL
ncbi:MAG: polynucleotide kinase-phosphatase [Clostridiales bacterium]|jgi:protein phosphatase|nr:polynucleotide kinase-phosphatase [Clostridiales bacterium]